MTKENRERQYKNFRKSELEYEALPHLNKGPTATSKIRANSKKLADAMLLKNPELSELDAKPEAKKETKPEEKEDGKKPKG